MKIKLKKTQADFLRQHGSIVTLPSGDKWYYFPFWWHEAGNNIFDSVDIDGLPQEVKDEIKSIMEK